MFSRSFICPVCGKKLLTKEAAARHEEKCWRETVQETPRTEKKVLVRAGV